MAAAARGRVRHRLRSASSAPAAAFLLFPFSYVLIHKLPDSWGQGRTARLLQQHAGGHAIRHYPRRSEGRARVDRQQAGLRVLVAGRGRGGAGLELSAGPVAGFSFWRGGFLEPKLGSLKPQSDAKWPCACFLGDSGQISLRPGFWAPCSPTPASIATWELEQELWPLGCVASAGSNWVLQSCKWWGSGAGGGSSPGQGL